MPTGGVYFSPCVSPGLNIGVSEPPTPVTNVPRRGHPCVSAPLPPAAGSCVLPRGRPCPWCHWALPIPLPTGGHLCSSQLVCSCPLRCVCLCPMAGSLPHSASGGVGLTTSIRGDISHTERQDTCSTLLTSPHALGQQTHACGRPGSHPGWLHTPVCTQSQTHWGPTRSHLPKWSVTWSVSITATLGASWAHTCHQSSSHSQSPPKSQTAAPFTGCVFGHGRLLVAFPHPYWQGSAGTPICYGGQKPGQDRAEGHVAPSVAETPCRVRRTARVQGGFWGCSRTPSQERRIAIVAAFSERVGSSFTGCQKGAGGPRRQRGERASRPGRRGLGVVKQVQSWGLAM